MTAIETFLLCLALVVPVVFTYFAVSWVVKRRKQSFEAKKRWLNSLDKLEPVLETTPKLPVMEESNLGKLPEPHSVVVRERNIPIQRTYETKQHVTHRTQSIDADVVRHINNSNHVFQDTTPTYQGSSYNSGRSGGCSSSTETSGSDSSTSCSGSSD